MNALNSRPNPICSIVIPMFNAEKWITKTLDSVVNQTMQSWQCLVVDDGSTDGSNSIVTAFSKTDPRITLIKIKNSGPANARNVGISKASGRFIAFLDADDIWLPTKLESQINSLKNSPEAAFTLCHHFLFQQDPNKILGAVYIKDFGKTMNGWINFWGEGPAASSALILDRLKVRSDLIFRIELFTTADFEFMMRLHEEYNYVSTPEILLGYRQHGNQMHDDIFLVEKELEVLNDLFLKSSRLGSVYSKSSSIYLLTMKILRGSQNVFVKIFRVTLKRRLAVLTLKLLRKRIIRSLSRIKLMRNRKTIQKLIFS